MGVDLSRQKIPEVMGEQPPRHGVAAALAREPRQAIRSHAVQRPAAQGVQLPPSLLDEFAGAVAALAAAGSR